jgi:hypothetical protein
MGFAGLRRMRRTEADVRLLGRVVASLPGLVVVVTLAVVVEVLALAVAVVDAVLALLILTVSGVVWLIQQAITWPLMPVRAVAIRWAYGKGIRDFGDDMTNGLALTIVFRSAGRLPLTVARAYWGAIMDAYWRVPRGYRLLFLRLPGSLGMRRVR